MRNKNVPTTEHMTDQHEGLVEVTHGVKLLRGADLSAIVASLPEHTPSDDDIDAPDMVEATDRDALKDAVDALVHEKLDPADFDGLKIRNSWLNMYENGDVMYAHRDYARPKRATTVIANISGTAMIDFPDTGVTIDVTEGDIILLDGMANPTHEVMATSDRVSVVGLYE